MAIDDLLKQGLAACKAGRNAEAHKLLMQVLEQDERNEKAWLWLTGVVDTDEERLTCLENVLAINPNNEIAQQGIESLRKKGALGLDSKPATQPPKDRPAKQPVVEMREDIQPEPSGESRKPAPRVKGRKTSTSPHKL